METITINKLGTARLVVRNGRQYYVAPLTSIVPGILPGSKGPLYYPPSEIQNATADWDGIPLTRNHPSVGGISVSAKTPGILEAVGLGFVQSSTYNSKLQHEGWFDVEHTKRIDNRIYDALKSGTPMELSTGLFTDNIQAPIGYRDHNGQEYKGQIASNHRPDHLAILPDQRGACSLRDGCGMLINSKGSEMQCTFNSEGVCTNCGGPGGNPGPCPMGGTNHKDRLELKRANGGNVIRTTTGYTEMDKHGESYYSHEGHLTGFKPHKDSHSTRFGTTRNNTMDRDAAITYLTTNCDCWKGKEKLLSNKDNFSDEDLTDLKTNTEKLKSVSIVVNKSTQGDDTTVDRCGGKTKKMMTANEWMESAPPEIRNAVTNAIEREQEEKLGIVTRLVGNVVDEATRKELATEFFAQSLPQLRKKLAMMPTINGRGIQSKSTIPQVDLLNFFGSGGGYVQLAGINEGSGLLGNATNDADDLLDPVTVNEDPDGNRLRELIAKARR